MSAVSQLIEYDGTEYFDPITGESIDDTTGAFLVDSEHAAGHLVAGIDSSVAIAQGTVTEAQNQANLDAAAAQAMTQLGLGTGMQSQWTKQQAGQYIATLQQIVLSQPHKFTPQTIANTQNFDVSGYLASYGNSGVPTTGAQVGAALKAALNAVTTSANVLQWALPLAVIGFFYFAAQSIGKDPGGQAKKSLEGVGSLY